MGRLILSLACNDHRNGAFLGKFDMAELHPPNGESLIRLHGPDVRLKVEERKGRPVLIIGRVVVPYRGSRTWYGNWCWDAYGVGLKGAVKVLAYLKSRGYGCEEAESSLFDRWRADSPVSGGDLIAAMGAYDGQAEAN